jgi:hypothetical protein
LDEVCDEFVEETEGGLEDFGKFEELDRFKFSNLKLWFVEGSFKR